MPYLGEIRPCAFAIVPVDWMVCQGQKLRVTDYPALFSLIGAFYGGDGRNTFRLPDLRQRVVVGLGDGEYATLGHTGGLAKVTLDNDHMPPHSHNLRCVNAGGTLPDPSGLLYAKPRAGSTAYSDTPTDKLNPGVLVSTGGNQPHDNLQPYLEVNFIICVKGTFPDGENRS